LFNGKPKASASCRYEDAFGLPLNELGSRLTLSYPSQSGAVQLGNRAASVVARPESSQHSADTHPRDKQRDHVLDVAKDAVGRKRHAQCQSRRYSERDPNSDPAQPPA
jgi:hypothetical protein